MKQHDAHVPHHRSSRLELTIPEFVPFRSLPNESAQRTITAHGAKGSTDVADLFNALCFKRNSQRRSSHDAPVPHVANVSQVVDSAISIFYNDMADLAANRARKEGTCRSLTTV